MSSDDEPISVWDVVARNDRLRNLEDRLQFGDLAAEFRPVTGDPLAGHGSQGGTVGVLATGEVVFVKRSDRNATGAALPDGVGEVWVRNEAAAYEIARLIGFEDIVLPSVLRSATDRDGNEIEVAVRLYVEPSPEGQLDEGAPLHVIDSDQIARAAIFDYIVEQTDRKVIGEHGGNWYVLDEPNREARLLLFDHQLCFGARPGFGLNSAIWDIAGHKIGPHVRALTSLLGDDARGRLSQFLTHALIDDVVERARQLLERYAVGSAER